MSLFVTAQSPNDTLEVRRGSCLWHTSAGEPAGHSRGARLMWQLTQPVPWRAGCGCALPAWEHLLHTGLCPQRSLLAPGASLDYSHLQHILAVANLKCLWEMSTATAPVGAGPRGTCGFTVAIEPSSESVCLALAKLSGVTTTGQHGQLWHISKFC